MRIERSEMLSEGAGTPRSAEQRVFNYLEEHKRYKLPLKSGLEEDERGGTIA